MLEDPSQTRGGIVALVGRANAGKSTLLNRLAGTRLAIVSAVAQTTRRTLRTPVMRGDAQIVFADLPGSQKPMDRMTGRMQATVESQVADADVLVWVVDARDVPGAGERAVARLIAESKAPFIIALNKVDGMQPATIAERIAAISEIPEAAGMQALVPISAWNGDGCTELMDELVDLIPEGPWLFPPDMSTDMRESELIAEYIREAMLPLLNDELPHATSVVVDEIEDDDEVDGRRVVRATIVVERTSQVGIIVGKGGSRIRDIGTAARERIMQVLGGRWYLDLRVKVRDRWRNDVHELERQGL